jgi:hypothetical protein
LTEAGKEPFAILLCQCNQLASGVSAFWSHHNGGIDHVNECRLGPERTRKLEANIGGPRGEHASIDRNNNSPKTHEKSPFGGGRSACGVFSLSIDQPNVFLLFNAFNDSTAATIDFTIEKTAAKAKLTVAPAIATKILWWHFPLQPI